MVALRGVWVLCQAGAMSGVVSVLTREESAPSSVAGEGIRPCQGANAAWYFVAVDGPDVGAVIPLNAAECAEVLGRHLEAISDRLISREHVEATWDEEGVFLREHGSTNGSRILTRFSHTARILGEQWQEIHPWERLLMGSSTWQLRPRPTSLLLPATPSRPGFFRRFQQRRSQAGRGVGMSWRIVLSLVFVGVMLIRILAMLSLWWRLLVLALILGLGVWALVRAFFRPPTQMWDAGLLLMHLEHCATRSPEPPESRAPSTREGPFPWQDAQRFSLWEQGDDPHCPGFYGPQAELTALWMIAANARTHGGARIHTPRGVRICGNGAKEVHLSLGAHCPTCQTQWSNDIPHVSMATTRADLPTHCDAIIPTATPPVSESWAQQVFTSPQDVAAGASGLPECVLAAELEDADTSATRLGCPLGVDEQQRPVIVDIVSDGPHGVIVGSTGSGKSEALITLLVGMASRYSPSALRLILLDYKGGATLTPLAQLPHTEVLLTDLTQERTLRTFEGIRCLLDQRSDLLATHGYASLNAWEERDPDSAPPRVIIACDEFTTFADLNPTLFQDILRWTAQGRALGIHVILATQRPDRALAPSILANVDLRLVLRCREASASHTLLGSDAALHLPPLPGRAVLDGRGTIQCAWVDDASTLCRTLAHRWRAHHAQPLWLAELPTHPTLDHARALLGAHLVGAGHVGPDLSDPAGSKSPQSESIRGQVGCMIGILDGIRRGSHTPLRWAGGHLRFEGLPHDRRALATAVHHASSAIAAGEQLPLIVCEANSYSPLPASAQTADHTTSPKSSCPVNVTPLNISSPRLVDVLANWEDPCVLAIPDLDALRAGLDELLGAVHSQALWNLFIRRAAATQITIVCAQHSPTTLWDKDGRAYSYRFLAAHSTQFLTQWGFKDTPLLTAREGHFILASAPSHPNDTTSTPTPLPALACLISPSHATSSTTHGTPEPTQAQHASQPQPGVKPVDAPVLAEYAQGSNGCLVITKNPEKIPPRLSQATTLTPSQWALISSQDADSVLVTDLSDEVKRALLPRAYHNDWLLRLRHLPLNSALLIHHGKAHFIEQI